MQRHCKNCGTSLQIGQQFCPQCGAAVDVVDTTSETGTTAVKNHRSRNRLIGIAILIIVLLLLIFAFQFAERPYLHVLQEGYTAIKEADAEDLISCVMPDESLDGLTGKQKKQLYEMVDDAIEEHLDSMNEVYGKRIKFKVKIKDKDKLKKEDLSALNNTLRSYDIKTKKAYAVEYAVTISGSKSKTTEIRNCYIYRYDDDWYVCEKMYLDILNEK